MDQKSARVIVFRCRKRGWRSLVMAITIYLFWGIAGIFAGWRLVVSAPFWWWQGALVIIWAGLLAVLQWPLRMLVRSR